jgi:hypothetical protein
VNYRDSPEEAEYGGAEGAEEAERPGGGYPAAQRSREAATSP